MTGSLAAKVGGGLAVTGTASVATASYVYSDHIFLYKSERDAISSETVVLSDGTNADPVITAVKISADTGNKWTCTIKAKLDVEGSGTLNLSSKRTELSNAIKAKLPTTSATGTEITDKDQKLKNKERLVRNCAKDKDKTASNDNVTASIFVTITGSEANNYSFRDANLKELFN